MTSEKIRDTKLRALIKAFLVFHKGKKFTAKEISSWINSANFCLNRSLCNAKLVGYLLSKGHYDPTHIFYDVESEKRGNLKYYWVEV